MNRAWKAVLFDLDGTLPGANELIIRGAGADLILESLEQLTDILGTRGAAM